MTTWKALRRFVRELVVRLRRRGRSAAFRALRLSGAAVASFVVAQSLLPGTVPVLAALTALLVIEVTLFGSLASGVQRVVSIVCGVLLAVSLSAVVDLTWWSLGSLVTVCIVIGQLLRLGPHLLEVPISAMLVLAVSGAQAAAATDRIVETLIGAAVGVAVNLVFPPAVRAGTAATAIEGFADEIAELLDTASQQLAEGVSLEQASRWLDEARRLSRHVPRIDRALADAQESRRLNLRALGLPDAQESLRGGLDALEHSAVAVRNMFRSILDGVRERREGDGEYAEDVRRAFAVLLGELAAAVRAFGHLVRTEVAPAMGSEEAALSGALESLQEARARTIELQLVDPRHDLAMWELSGTLLETVGRVLHELDVEQHARRRARRREELDRRVALQATQERLRATTQHLDDYGRRRSAGL